nr:3-hydroxyacyl-CoA dehydrogenase family protein [Arthrobacter sp. SO3]
MNSVLPDRVGVLGGGRMGAGIAHAFLIAGADVIVVERDEDAATIALGRVTEGLRASVTRRATDESLNSLTGRMSVSDDYSAFSSCGLVVEAVPEEYALKSAALTAVEKHLTPTAWLATNTSSLSVARLSGSLARPANFCGLHFFNPVPSSLLVEVVLGPSTSPDLAAAARSWIQALGKTAVLVNDAPGFASSRLGIALALEAMRMVEDGVASAADIDSAMVLGYKHQTGPLMTTDVVGLDVRLGIAEYLESTLGARFAPPQILRDKVARGELGRKSGQGFFGHG